MGMKEDCTFFLLSTPALAVACREREDGLSQFSGTVTAFDVLERNTIDSRRRKKEHAVNEEEHEEMDATVRSCDKSKNCIGRKRWDWLAEPLRRQNLCGVW